MPFPYPTPRAAGRPLLSSTTPAPHRHRALVEAPSTSMLRALVRNAPVAAVAAVTAAAVIVGVRGGDRRDPR